MVFPAIFPAQKCTPSFSPNSLIFNHFPAIFFFANFFRSLPAQRSTRIERIATRATIITPSSFHLHIPDSGHSGGRFTRCPCPSPSFSQFADAPVGLVPSSSLKKGILPFRFLNSTSSCQLPPSPSFRLKLPAFCSSILPPPPPIPHPPPPPFSPFAPIVAVNPSPSPQGGLSPPLPSSSLSPLPPPLPHHQYPPAASSRPRPLHLHPPPPPQLSHPLPCSLSRQQLQQGHRLPPNRLRPSPHSHPRPHRQNHVQIVQVGRQVKKRRRNVAALLHSLARLFLVNFRLLPAFPAANFRLSMKKLAAFLLLIALLAGFLLHLAELLDVYCDTDADCKPPTVCRLVCRRNCKSVCVLVVPEEQDHHHRRDDGGELWTTRKQQPELGVLFSPPTTLTMNTRKLHRRPPAKSGLEPATEKATSEEDKPFETDANPFVAAVAVPFRPPSNAPLPPPGKKTAKEAAAPAMVMVTPLTISEAELEAELHQMRDGNGAGPVGFVTAPGGSGEAEKVATADPFEPRGNSREQLFGTGPPRVLASVRSSSQAGGMAKGGGHVMMMSTSVELVRDDATSPMFRHRSTTTTSHSPPTTTVSPPSFSPQPPGLMPTQTSPVWRPSTTPKGASTSSSPPPPSSSPTPPPNSSTQRSKENSAYGSDEEFEHRKAGLGKQQFFKNAERPAPWFPKMPLVRPPLASSSSTISPFLAAMRRTTQRVPVHRPQFGAWMRATSTTPPPGPTTQRTTLKKCDPPPVCGRNCGIVIDRDGCQSCQCLWASSKACFSDVDCRPLEGQVCDLGRCECGPGYAHHPTQSGICIPTDLINHQLPARQRGVTLSHTSPLPASSPSLSPPSSSLLISGRSQHQVPLERQFNGQKRRLKRTPEKPHREERLQWPGPCDRDDQCPPQLYCIEGDCWTLEPERALERRKDSATIGAHSHAAALARAVLPAHRSNAQHQPSQQRKLLVPPLVGQQHTSGNRNAAALLAKVGGGPELAKAESKQQHPQQMATIEEEPKNVVEKSSTAVPLPPLASAPVSDEQQNREEGERGNDNVERGQHHEEEEGEEEEGGIFDQRNYPNDDEQEKVPEEEETDYDGRKQPAEGEEGGGGQSGPSTTTFAPSSSSPSPFPSISASSEPTLAVPLPQATISVLSASRENGKNPIGPEKIQKRLPEHAKIQSSTQEPTTKKPIQIHPPSARPPADYFDGTSIGPPPSAGDGGRGGGPRGRNEFGRRLSPPAGPPQSRHPSPSPLPAAHPVQEPITIVPPTNATTKFEPKAEHRGLEVIGPEEDGGGGGGGADSVVAISKKGEETEEGSRRRIFHDYSRRNRIRRPVQVEMTNSRELIKDECRRNGDCGHRFVCCRKRWCDLGGECGLAKFCLPSCELTKLAHLSELAPAGRPQMDLVYD